MKLAYTMVPGRGDMDLLLYRLSEDLAAKGIRCCGTVQINTYRPAGDCDMDVKVLPVGPRLRISQTLGTSSRGCRLDPCALEDAVGLTETALSQGADLLIINKFGKHEAEGRGFRSAIAVAIERDIPVFVGVNRLNLRAFLDFAGAEAVLIEPSVSNILEWSQSVVLNDINAA